MFIVVEYHVSFIRSVSVMSSSTEQLWRYQTHDTEWERCAKRGCKVGPFTALLPTVNILQYVFKNVNAGMSHTLCTSTYI